MTDKLAEFVSKINALTPERRDAFFRWLAALGRKEPEAKRIAKVFSVTGMAPEETWDEIARIYGDDGANNSCWTLIPQTR